MTIGSSGDSDDGCVPTDDSECMYLYQEKWRTYKKIEILYIYEIYK